MSGKKDTVRSKIDLAISAPKILFTEKAERCRATYRLPESSKLIITQMMRRHGEAELQHMLDELDKVFAEIREAAEAKFQRTLDGSVTRAIDELEQKAKYNFTPGYMKPENRVDYRLRVIFDDERERAALVEPEAPAATFEEFVDQVERITAIAAPFFPTLGYDPDNPTYNQSPEKKEQVVKSMISFFTEGRGWPHLQDSDQAMATPESREGAILKFILTKNNVRIPYQMY